MLHRYDKNKNTAQTMYVQVTETLREKNLEENCNSNLLAIMERVRDGKSTACHLVCKEMLIIFSKIGAAGTNSSFFVYLLVCSFFPLIFISFCVNCVCIVNYLLRCLCSPLSYSCRYSVIYIYLSLLPPKPTR